MEFQSFPKGFQDMQTLILLSCLKKMTLRELERLTKETERIIDALNKRNRSYSILLDLKGKLKSSEEMAEEIENISLQHSEINFIIGGSNGVDDELRRLVDFRLAFSSFTFPHQLMRLILMEQIYRWISITKNIKYHK